MTRYQLAALVINLVGVTCGYLLLSDQIAQFPNPKLATSLIGLFLLWSNYLSNYLPSMTGKTLGDPKARP